MSVYKQVSFTREELFARVWTAPVLKLAQEIGVSDVAIAKACRRYDIPTPARGFWAKSEAKRPKRPKLPPSKGGVSESVTFNVLDPVLLEEIRASRADRPAIQEGEVDVPNELVAPHKLVSRFRDKALAATRHGVFQARFKMGDCLDLRVTPQHLERALRIADALIKACEAKGFPWSVDQKGTHIKCQGASIDVVLRERVTRRLVPLRKEAAPLPPPLRPGQRWEPGALQEKPLPQGWEDENWAATGELTLTVENYTAAPVRKRWQDSKTGRLEETLGSFLASLPEIALRIKQLEERRTREREEWGKRERAEADRKRKLEHQRRLRNKLAATVEAWENASKIRAFCDALRAKVPAMELLQADAANELLEWALKQADVLDPLLHPVQRWGFDKVPDWFPQEEKRAGWWALKGRDDLV